MKLRTMALVAVVTAVLSCGPADASAGADITPPLVTVTTTAGALAVSADRSIIDLSGTAVSGADPVDITWSTDRGYSGSCVGYAVWSTKNVPVDPGANLVTVQASDSAGNVGSDSIIVTYNPPPVVTITKPTDASSCTATTPKLDVEGAAITPFVLASVLWETDRGAKGVCVGGANWRAADVPLEIGDNLVIVTAVDSNGKAGSDTLAVSVTDVTKPVVTVTSPTLEQAAKRNAPTLDIAGTASDDFGVTRVAWSNDRGGSGQCSGIAAWSAGGLVLASGTNVITVSATDVGGNVGTSSVTVNYDPTKPTTVAVTITSPTTGPSDTAPTSVIALSGTASADLGIAKVAWRTDHGAAGNCDGLTSWSASSIPLVLGSNTITVTATDTTGDTAMAALAITASDASPPTVRIDVPSKADASSHKGNILAIGGVASDDFGVKVVTWSNNRGGSGTCDGTDSWAFTGIALSPGDNVITVTAVDYSGNTGSDSVTVTGTADTAAITIAIDTPTDKSTLTWDQLSVDLGGVASGGLPLRFVSWRTDAGRGGNGTGTNTWTATGVPLIVGDTLVTVSAIDSAGDVGTTTLRVTVTDTTSPVIKITSPSAESASNYTYPSVTISGTASDNLGIREIHWLSDRGEGGTLAATVDWSIPKAALQIGPNVFTVTATDLAGNTGSDTLTVNYRPTGPTVVITDPTGEPTYATDKLTLDIAGSATGGAAVASVRWISDRGNSGVCEGTDNWRAVAIPLEYGSNNFTVIAVDANGESGVAHLAVTLPDKTPPTITILIPTSDQATRRVGAAVTIAGTASDNVGVAQVAWSNSAGYTGVCSGTTLWLAPWVPLQYGDNAITVTVTDVFGNTATADINVTRWKVSPEPEWRGLMMAAVPVIPDWTDPKLEIGFAEGFWASFDASAQKYYQYPDKPTWFDPVDSTPGRGFWSIFTYSQPEPLGYILPQNQEATIHLYPGWNMVGNPFVGPVKWDRGAIMVRPAGTTDRRAMIDADDVVRQYGIGWQQNDADLLTGAYYIIFDAVYPGIVNEIKPWRAFWIRAIQECDLILPPPE